MSGPIKTCYFFSTVFFGSFIWLVTSGEPVLAGVIFTFAALFAFAGIFDPEKIKAITFGKDKGIKIFSPEERKKVLQTSKDELSPQLKKELEQLAEDARSRKETQRAPEDYLTLANEAHKERKYSDTLAFSLAGLQLSPKDIKLKSTLIYRLGSGYYELGELSLAKRLYKESIREEPESPFPYNGMGNVCLKQDELEEAEKFFKKASDLDSNFAHPYNNLGLLYREQGKVEEAEEYLKKARDINPDIGKE